MYSSSSQAIEPGLIPSHSPQLPSPADIHAYACAIAASESALYYSMAAVMGLYNALTYHGRASAHGRADGLQAIEAAVVPLWRRAQH